jgi:2-polyprenyl-6-methoxyphenol hydroxylase-like FAD-dependent oxidoreductase
MNTQVLVVGAGPVGLTMAAELARYGIKVRIVDKSSGRSTTSKALAVWSRTLELLERADCAQAFVAKGRKMDGMNVYSGGKRVAFIDFRKIKSRYNYPLMLPQSDSESILEEHLNALGVQVEREVELASFTEDDLGVRAILKSGRGEEACRVDWLVGCDGAHSAVRHALGIPFDGETLPSDWVLADVHMQGLPTPPSELSSYWHEQGVIAIFPIAEGRYRLIAEVESAPGARPADPTLAQVQAIMDQRGPGGVTLSDPVWLSSFRINERKVARYRSGRVFLAGDAAHVHSPAGGQGMNTGMQDAFNLAWKLALVCNGTAQDPKLLDSYSQERSAVGEKVLADAARLTKVATLKNPAAVAVRNAIGGMLFGLMPVNEFFAQNFSETTIRYAESPINGVSEAGHDVPRTGERIVPAEQEGPFGVGPQPRFALLAAPTPAIETLLLEHSSLLESQLRAPPRSDGIWLVRPDGYVACVAPAAGAIDDYLKAMKAGAPVATAG